MAGRKICAASLRLYHRKSSFSDLDYEMVLFDTAVRVLGMF